MNNINRNKIIKILPNISITNNSNIEDSYLEENDIKNIIAVNIEDINLNSNYNLININYKSFINFDHTNNIIIQLIKSGENILIISNISIGFLILCGFIIKYLNLSLIEALSISKFHNINLNIIPNQFIVELFEYYKKIKN